MSIIQKENEIQNLLLNVDNHTSAMHQRKMTLEFKLKENENVFDEERKALENKIKNLENEQSEKIKEETRIAQERINVTHGLLNLSKYAPRITNRSIFLLFDVGDMRFHLKTMLKTYFPLIILIGGNYKVLSFN